jgi:hypothetical protein
MTFAEMALPAFFAVSGLAALIGYSLWLEFRTWKAGQKLSVDTVSLVGLLVPFPLWLLLFLLWIWFADFTPQQWRLGVVIFLVGWLLALVRREIWIDPLVKPAEHGAGTHVVNWRSIFWIFLITLLIVVTTFGGGSDVIALADSYSLTFIAILWPVARGQRLWARYAAKRRHETTAKGLGGSINLILLALAAFLFATVTQQQVMLLVAVLATCFSAEKILERRLGLKNKRPPLRNEPPPLAAHPQLPPSIEARPSANN